MASLSQLLSSIGTRGRRLLSLSPVVSHQLPTPNIDLFEAAGALLTSRGEASLVAAARHFLDSYRSASAQARRAFLRDVSLHLGPSPAALDAAIGAYRAEPGIVSAAALHTAAEPRRQELIRRLNLAPGATHDLVAMRADLLAWRSEEPALRTLDLDFLHLFGSWFNRGFLLIERIDWSSSAAILEKIIRYEAVHAIRDWRDLQSRLEPGDRRCFAFFHPRLPDEPLIFVEVALTRDIPDAIAPLLAQDRTPIDASKATTAVFYSISNCQSGLAGVSFGNFLIKQVVEELRRELPNLRHFATLSPVPGFAHWLTQQKARGEPVSSSEDRAGLLRSAASYLFAAKDPAGRPADPVARFHLGNGARLERINFQADPSPKGLQQSLGVMVNYLYDLDAIVANHEAYADRGEVALGSAVRSLLAVASPLVPRYERRKR